MKADKLILGNIITMDEVKPTAKALTVKDGRIQYVGNVQNAKALCDEHTTVLDYGNNYIYPGFLDSHTHGMFAGYRAIGQADVSQILPPDKDKYREIIRTFIEQHPEKDTYLIAGWAEDGKTEFTSEFLDEICADKPVMMNTGGGHSVLLNHAAIKAYGITKEFAQQRGTDLVRVDANGEPTGYLCENPAVEIITSLPVNKKGSMEYLLHWQNFAFANGFTGASDAGVELVSPAALDAYFELDDKDELKFYSFGYLMAKDNLENPAQRAKEIAELKKAHPGKHFIIVGAKVFLDGVLEAHTSWLAEDYTDQPGYHGNERFNDPAKLTELIAETGKYGLAVHAHSEGSGSIRFFLNCIEAGQKISGNMDQRNASAHLHLVCPEDLQRMADTNSVAVVPPLWVPKLPGAYEIECGYVGKERSDSSYPIKSFFDAGAVTVFHSDYPVSPQFNAPLSIYTAVTRGLPAGIIEGIGGSESVRGEKEAISRQQALLAMTKNVAYMWHQENNLGSIEIGKIANFSIFDADFLHEDIEKIPKAKVVATIVDGEEVFRA